MKTARFYNERNQTPDQIFARLNEANQSDTVVITDRGGEDMESAKRFFKDQATAHPDDKGWSISDAIEKDEIHIWRTNDDGQTEPTQDQEQPTPTPEEPTETPEAAAARFWREAKESLDTDRPEYDPESLEDWLKPITDDARRNATRAAILERAEPMNLPTLTPRLTEDDLRDILSDTRTDLAAAEEARDKAEQEAHHAKEDSEAAQERIEELEDALEKEEEAHQETKEAAEQGDIFSPEHGMTWAEALEEAEKEAEEARTNPDTGNTWEEDLCEAQSTLVEWAEKHDEEKAKREKAEEDLTKAEERINDTLTDLEAAKKAAQFWEEEHERNRDRISRILDAYFKRDDKAAREAAGAGPFLKAKIRTNAALTKAEEMALIDLIEMTEEMADDGTPNGRDAWAGPTADDPYAAAAKKTTIDE